jgi:hypothetical protein
MVEYMGGSMPRIYAALDNKQVEYQSPTIEVEVKINNQTISILTDSRASHSYINSNIIEIFHLKRSKHKKYYYKKCQGNNLCNVGDVRGITYIGTTLTKVKE